MERPRTPARFIPELVWFCAYNGAMSEGRRKLSWIRLLLAAVSGSISAAILVPFFAGYFPPLGSSALIGALGFFLAGIAIGTPFKRGIVCGIVALFFFPAALSNVRFTGPEPPAEAP